MSGDGMGQVTKKGWESLGANNREQEFPSNENDDIHALISFSGLSLFTLFSHCCRILTLRRNLCSTSPTQE